MKELIDIPDELYEAYKGRPPRTGDEGMDMIAQAIANGTPLQDGEFLLTLMQSVMTPEQIREVLQTMNNQGEWITRHKQNSFGQDVVCFECNKCGEYKLPIIHTMITEPLGVCPNCGADMRRNTKRKGTPIEGNNESYNCENWIP